MSKTMSKGLTVLILTSILLLSGCTDYTAPSETEATGTPVVDTPPERHNQGEDTIPTTMETEAAKQKVETVKIQNFTFSPATLTIQQGTTVTWTNLDSASHRVKGEDFAGTTQSKGENWSYTFNEKGTFNYICSIHPYMSGKIIVE
jgi:plastocyanin